MNYEEKLQSLIEGLIGGHGYVADKSPGKLVYPQQDITIYSRIYFTEPTSTGVMMQIDLAVQVFKHQREFHESFVGLGKDEEAALANAIENFSRSALHVMLAAFFDDPKIDLAREQWQIKGEKWTVVLGDPVMRGYNPQIVEVAKPLLDDIQKLIETGGVDGTAGWLSIFLSSSEKQVLLNDKHWPEAEELFEKYQWPAPEPYYSLRLCIALVAA